MVWIKRLELQAFRNVQVAAVDLGPRFNFLFGANGAGKTALLEAVHLLARGRSFRSQYSTDLVARDAAALLVRAVLVDEHTGVSQITFTRSRSGEAGLRINGDVSRRMSRAAALLPVEVMVASMVELVFGGPGLRRQWLDWGVFHVKHEYLGLQRRYNMALRQRNACLKGIAAGRRSARELAPWTAELADSGSQIDTLRKDHLADLGPRVKECLAELESGFLLEARYRQGWPDATELGNQLSENVEREVKSGATAYGPHRADIDFSVDGMPGASTLSRGQAKTLASALMLAQADLIGEQGLRRAVFLIDDIGAELDAQHRVRLFAALVARRAQVIATSAEAPGASVLDECPDYAMFHVEQGCFTRI